jgi:hypothetical protein
VSSRHRYRPCVSSNLPKNEKIVDYDYDSEKGGGYTSKRSRYAKMGSCK